MPAFRSVMSVLVSSRGDLLYELKAGPAGGPAAALRPGRDTTVTRETGLTLRTP
jgi:hypothetical protein